MNAAILVNGEPRTQIDVRDRGLQYGDGLFETMAVLDGSIRRRDAHMARLHLGCSRLGIPAPQKAVLDSEIDALIAGCERAVLKLIVTRGFGGRGYRAPEQPSPSRVLWLDAWPQYPPAWAEEGVAVRVCRTVLSDQPQLAGIKHLNRLEQILARREWSEAGEALIAEGLMRDARGHVVCGTMSNVFVVRAGRLLTPAIDRCGVAGTLRQAVLHAAVQLGIGTGKVDLDLDTLRQAEEIFLTNALIGVWPVRRIDDRDCAIGPMTRRIQAAI